MIQNSESRKRDQDRARVEEFVPQAARDAVDQIRALHNGVHQCVHGQYWNNGSLTYNGNIAEPGPCDTIRLLDEATQ